MFIHKFIYIENTLQKKLNEIDCYVFGEGLGTNEEKKAIWCNSKTLPTLGRRSHITGGLGYAACSDGQS